MKLRTEAKSRQPKPKASDVLEIPHPEREDFDFDVMRDVPVRVWDNAHDLMERLIQKPSDYEHLARGLCRLAAVNPALKMKLRNSPELRKVILEFFKTDWGAIGFDHLDLAYDLADFLLIFPEFRNQQTNKEVKFGQMMQAIRRFVKTVDVNHWDTLVKMLTLFPEKQSEILAYAQEIKQSIWSRSVQQPAQFFEYSIERSAYARLLFPEETPQILGIVQPQWKEVLHSIQHDDTGDHLLPIFGAVILSAAEATITPAGDLRVVPRPPQMPKGRELPPRFTT